MGFELDRTQMNGYETRMDTTLLQEETLEMIVPDACPDILRVIETDGKVLLTRKEALEGRVEAGGLFKLSVLYLPDGEEGIRHLDVSLPFTCTAEGREIDPDCTVVACMHLCRADTRAMNPRKVLVRAEAAVGLTVFAPKAEAVCSRVAEACEEGVEQLTETREVYLTACVQEKPFPLSDEIVLSASKPAAVELLKSRVRLNRGECKLIGSKLIVKGSAEAALLYRGEDNGIYTAAAELPFSQIMEVAGVAEDAECELTLALTGADCILDPQDDGRTVSVNGELLTQAVVRELRELEVLVDAYSTKLPLRADWEQCWVEGRLDRGVHSQNVREVWEVPETVREIMDCRVTVGQVTRAREGEKLLLSAQAELQALAVSEEGEVISLRHPVEVVCPQEVPEGGLCFCQCEGSGEVYAAPTSAGVEARFTLDFRCCAVDRRQITALGALEPGEAAEESGEQPSLVLRMLEPGERLWDVAKAYSTTIADIVSANELEDPSAAVGRLLLIPRKR